MKASILFLFFILHPSVFASICTSVSNSITTQQDSFTGVASVQTWGVSSRTCTYIRSIYKSAILKLNPDDSQAWLVSYSLSPSMKSLAVDSSENFVYFASWTAPINIFKLQGVDGVLNAVYSCSSIYAQSNDIKIHLLQDNSGFYILSLNAFSGKVNICRYLFSTSASMQCQEITDVSGYAYSQLMITTSLFFIGTDTTTPYPLRFYKVTFGQTAVDWESKMLCSSATCSTHPSESLISNDNSKIYIIFMYGNPWFIYFASFNVTNGNIIGTRYKSSQNCANIYGSAQTENYLFFSGDCTPYVLGIFDKNANTFIFKQFTGYLTQLTKELASGRLIVAGCKSGNGYYTRFKVESISAHQDFSSYTMSMNPLSSGTDDIILESGVMISIESTLAITNPLSSGVFVSYINVSASISDVYYQTDYQSFSVVENNTIKITPDLPCSSSGLTLISYSMSSYNGGSVLSWISINSGTGELSITAPDVSLDSDFYFYIDSIIFGIADPIHKLIKLTVKDCTALNCLKCQSASVSMCSLCNSSYILNSGSCILQNISDSPLAETSKALAITVQSAIGIVSGIIIISALMNTSSLASIWLMINQVQMFFLLLLTRAYIPDEVKTVIIGCKFSLNPFVFISFENMKLYESFINNFNFELSNDLLDPLEIKSDSTIYNTNSFFIMMILMILLHLVVLLVMKLFTCEGGDGECSCLLKFVYIIANKAFKIMTFNYYIRTILETSQFLLVSSIYEVYKFNTSHSLRIISLFSAILIISMLISVIAIQCGLAISSYRVIESKHNKFGEFFEGIKMRKKFKLYSPILLIRKTIYILLLLTLIAASSRFLIAILSFIQIIPFEEIKCNIIEIINELFFLVLLSSLIYLNTENKWSSTFILIYICIIAFNSIIIFLIVLIVEARNIIIKLRKKCSKSKDPSSNGENVNKIAPKTNEMEITLKNREDTSNNMIQSNNRSHLRLHREKRYPEYDDFSSFYDNSRR